MSTTCTQLEKHYLNQRLIRTYYCLSIGSHCSPQFARIAVSGQYVVADTETKMTESNVSFKAHVVDNKQSKVEHQMSPSETDNSNSIQQAPTSTSADDCGYLRIISDELTSGETVQTVNESESDVTDSRTHSQCIQQQQPQEINSAPQADDHMNSTITDGNDVSLIQCYVS